MALHPGLLKWFVPALVLLAQPGWAYRASLETSSLQPWGYELISKCNAGLTPPPGNYDGGWSCSPGTQTGTDPYVSHADANVFASADLRDGKLRLAANASGSATVGLGDMLWLDIPGLDPGEVQTISFDLVVNGTFARAPGQDRGQAGYQFLAASGLYTYALTDMVMGSVGWKTASGSNVVNSTATPEEFYTFSTIGDWTQLATNHFVASIDVSGDDPTLGFKIGLSAGGPADFSNTATVTLSLPDGSSFVSESGVFLSAVPEPASAGLLAVGLALLAGLRRRR
ncbi:MAG: PEP-CTERM sorting domain-containing protein [Ideonella sp.]|nr:PEP-CTERM sorting domain-containing protein [Ideonella sp.]